MASADVIPAPVAELFEVLSSGRRWRHYPWEKTDIGPTPAAAVSGSRAINTGDISVLTGYAVAETTGAATAAIRLRDGNNANGEVIARINLVANESVRDFWTPAGVRVFTGHLFLEVLSGSVEGVVYWTPQYEGNFYEPTPGS